jgi:hypothetical protein
LLLVFGHVRRSRHHEAAVGGGLEARGQIFQLVLQVGVDATPQMLVEQGGDEHVSDKQGCAAHQGRTDDQPER